MSNAGLLLYRQILREHRRKLPPIMRAVGDDYLRNEFRLHKKVSSAAHLDLFMDGWRQYLSSLQRSADGKVGRNISSEEQNFFSKEQQTKMKELLTETKNSILS